jgi:hypothetical protein
MAKVAFVLLALSVAVPVIGTNAVTAAPERKQRACDSYCQRFPSATVRRLRMRAHSTTAASITRGTPTPIP